MSYIRRQKKFLDKFEEDDMVDKIDKNKKKIAYNKRLVQKESSIWQQYKTRNKEVK